MRKLYTILSLFLLLFFYQSEAQIASFNFSGSDGDEPNWNSSSTATGVQSCAMTRGSGVVPIANADRFNSKGWTTASSPDLNDYIQFVISPQAGYSVTISTISLQHQRSSTGPKSFVIRTSQNDFGADATAPVTIPDVNTNQTSVFSFPSPITTTSPITIRIYGYNAELENGTWGPGESIDGNDIVVSGSFMILPVRFVNVRAFLKTNAIEVSWSNATESDVKYYVVERSKNGQQFSDLQKLTAVKNDGSNADYSITDVQPFDGANYYRIKAMEINGHVIYSRIVKIESNRTTSSLSVYPNPVQAGSSIMLQMNGLTPGRHSLSVYNAAAQLVYRQEVSINARSLTQSLPLQNLQKGTYIVEVKGSTTHHQRFVIQ